MAHASFLLAFVIAAVASLAIAARAPALLRQLLATSPGSFGFQGSEDWYQLGVTLRFVNGVLRGWHKQLASSELRSDLESLRWLYVIDLAAYAYVFAYALTRLLR